jgi:methionine--tRNA ligase beta chain
MISIEQFKAVEAKIGTILSAEKVENADKLLRLTVDFGEETGPRQIVSGIAEHYAPESLVGKQCPFVTNLEPRTIRGLESRGMILAGGLEGGITLLHPDKNVPPGTGLR